jgi:hypothetical protein
MVPATPLPSISDRQFADGCKSMCPSIVYRRLSMIIASLVAGLNQGGLVELVGLFQLSNPVLVLVLVLVQVLVLVMVMALLLILLPVLSPK